ncbi:DUF4389 domain-containing protein [Thiohalorhabdus methylotrophus]|uniref:DUF4389 domain-containing protein n=1 Tax=Thiohalorhabdus methylotrophus TaxID=3242694 RepID=A0ABV4TWT4_9GAMM
MSSEIRRNLSSGATWLRGLYMLLFAVIFNLAELVLAAVALFQFAAHLLSGAPNQRLRDFGDNLARYLREMAAFLTYSSEIKPFPFSPWPGNGESGRSSRKAEEAQPPARNELPEAGDGGDEEGGEPNESGVR